jgi:pimeloyl-ACP methyl ester carboxylesterase
VIWLILGACVAAVGAAPFVIEHYRTAMSDGRRGSAPGQFVELSQGVTHYHLSGPTDAPLVVCVHGLTTPSFVWGQLTRGLVALGFRVLVYDLYGRGYSDRPQGMHDKQFFNTQLTDLLSRLQLRGPSDLIGYSMGGAIGAGFAAAHPAMVRRLVLLAPAGMHLGTAPLVRFVKERGILGTWLMLAAYPRQMRKGIRAEMGAPPEITEGQHAQLMYQGFVPAVLSSLRGILRVPMQREHLALRRTGLPVLAIWGAQDSVIPASAMGRLAEWNRTVQHEVIEGAGHGLPYTHAPQVLAQITAFLPLPGRDGP